MASSGMELQLGVLGFLPTTCRSKRKQNASMIFTHCAAFLHVFIFTLRPQYIRTWQITVIYIPGKIRIHPIWASSQNNKDDTGSVIPVCLWAIHSVSTWWSIRHGGQNSKLCICIHINRTESLIWLLINTAYILHKCILKILNLQQIMVLYRVYASYIIIV